MAIVTLDFGSKVDMLNKGELAEALAEDARLRAIVAGVKSVDAFYGPGTIGAAQVTFTTPTVMVASGYVWAIMNIGLELAAASTVRVYKGIPASGGGAPTGSGRFVGIMSNFITPSTSFSKGQFMMRAGDQLTLVTPSPGQNILSVFITAIEIPAERIGELLL